MRTIKFRAWYHNGIDKKVGTMQYDVAVKNNEAEVLDTDGIKKWSNCVEIMQFTGLYDKNGKEVFEGDVVESAVLGLVMRVTWNQNIPGFEVRGAHVAHLTKANEWKVLGNIYENPELLKGKK